MFIPLARFLINRRTLWAFFFIIFTVPQQLLAFQEERAADPGAGISTREEAIHFIEAIKQPGASPYWPHVKPELFLENLKANIYHPLELNQGSNTNFCGYAAMSYLPLHTDPLGYAKFMLELYHTGRAKWGKQKFTPSAAIKEAAGTLRFKGVLDIRPADQIWFLLLADHFKGYLNFFNPNYNPGDENTFWAAVNFGKFNRMIRRLLHYKVESSGSDLLHPWVRDLYGYLHRFVRSGGYTYIYVNNTFLHKKNHGTKAGFPTHFLLLEDINRTGDKITITYWDYGGRTLQQVTDAFLKKIVFGVSHCTKP